MNRTAICMAVMTLLISAAQAADETLSGRGADTAKEPTYTCEQLTPNIGRLTGWAQWLNCGPREIAQINRLPGLVVDKDGNIYGVVNNWVGRGTHEGWLSYECVILKLDAKTGRVTRLAGGPAGAPIDGPGEIAQFSAQFYSSGGFGIDEERGYLYLADNKNGLMRRIRTSDGYTTTPAPELKGVRGVAVDQKGAVYVSIPYKPKAGLWRLTPEGPKDEETYKVEMVSEKSSGGYLAADAIRQKVYGAGRGENISTVTVWDLSSGQLPVERRPLAVPVDYPKGKAPAYFKSDGPVENAQFWCPCGLSISPDGRYLFLGGGDEYTFRRIDVQAKRVSSLYCSQGYKRFGGRTGPDILYTWKEREENQALFSWPLGSFLAADGSFYIGQASLGVYRLTPLRGCFKTCSFGWAKVSVHIGWMRRGRGKPGNVARISHSKGVAFGSC